jgi:hypothetical protein
MGPEIRENLSSEIARIYHALDGGLTPLSTLWPGAPTQKHKERDEARAEMVRDQGSRTMQSLLHSVQSLTCDRCSTCVAP